MQAWGLTDPGCVRVQNQDAYGVHTFEEDSLLCTVCGGHSGPAAGGQLGHRVLQDVPGIVPGQHPGNRHAVLPAVGHGGDVGSPVRPARG